MMAYDCASLPVPAVVGTPIIGSIGFGARPYPAKSRIEPPCDRTKLIPLAQSSALPPPRPTNESMPRPAANARPASIMSASGLGPKLAELVNLDAGGVQKFARARQVSWHGQAGIRYQQRASESQRVRQYPELRQRTFTEQEARIRFEIKRPEHRDCFIVQIRPRFPRGSRYTVAMRRLMCGWAVITLALAVGIQAAPDWPQFLGSERNGVYRGPALAETWGANGPRVVWRKTIGQGLSGPVVAQGRLILFHRVSNREVVESFDALTGAAQWQYGYPTTYRDDFGFDEGPRAVPVVADGVVYTFGAEGQLHAIDLAKGTRIWSEDTKKRFSVPKGFFGAAGSPLVENGRVLANIGGTQRRHRRV